MASVANPNGNGKCLSSKYAPVNGVYPDAPTAAPAPVATPAAPATPQLAVTVADAACNRKLRLFHRIFQPQQIIRTHV